DHVRAARDQRVEIGRGVAVAGGDEGDEGGVAFGEGGGEETSCHASKLRTWETRRLSPRGWHNLGHPRAAPNRERPNGSIRRQRLCRSAGSGNTKPDTRSKRSLRVYRQP